MARIGILARGAFLLVCGMQVWTQVAAYHYGYHPLLGAPLWSVRAFYRVHSLYAPWKVLVWRWQWGSPWLRLTLIGGMLVMLALAYGLRWLTGRLKATQPPEMTGHGTTAWATRRDVRKSGLL